MVDILTLRNEIKKTSLLLALLLFSCFIRADISITMKGKWTPVCNGVEVSQHNRYDKALEVVINQNVDCDIIPPNRFEIRFTKPELVSETKDITVSWIKPTVLNDGTALATIDRFNIYYAFDGVLQDVIEVEADSALYTLANVPAGSHSFKMSTVSNGVEGQKSDTVTVEIIE